MSGKRHNNTPDYREHPARLVIEAGQPVVQTGLGQQVPARQAGPTTPGSYLLSFL
jgi:hypothetical protein